MRIVGFLALAGLSILIPATAQINMGTSSDTVSFNGDKSTLTLGNDSCDGSVCTMSGTGAGAGVGAFDWKFTMPDDASSPFSYFGEPSSITTTGSPALGFSLNDANGDSASGTFALTSLAGDGNSGVDIFGNVTIGSITPGAGILAFDSFFGLPSATALAFTLDVGNCTSGRKSVACIQVTDPTAQYESLTMAQGVPATPEPGTLALFAGSSLALYLFRRRRVR